MARVTRTRTGRFRVVNSRNKVPVGRPNTFKTRSSATTRAKAVKCKVMRKC